MSTTAPQNIHDTIAKHMIADGIPITFDLAKSHGCWIVDAVTGAEYLDFYSFFASLPLGFGHPCLETADAKERLLAAATVKPANSDADTAQLADFVETFGRLAMPAPFEHLFLIDGGALAVENGLKAAFDWKVRKNMAAGRGELGSKILHFRQAFHGRSGYTMSLTNTEPMKIAYFPKFDWPRVSNPALRFPITDEETARVAAEEAKSIAEIEAAFDAHPHDIAGIIIEPIQGEGGDNHFRAEFLAKLREIADQREALLIFDEVQTGFGATGKLWAWEHFGVAPDIVCFGKKTQVCGIMGGPRLDEVPDNVFRLSSRINSTWGGNLVDLVRCQIILETMAKDGVVGNAAKVGGHLQCELTGLENEFDGVTNARGRGLFCAFDCRDGAHRDAVVDKVLEHGLLVLKCGERSLRVRPALTVTEAEVDQAIERLRVALREVG